MLAYFKFTVRRSLRRYRRELKTLRTWSYNYYQRHIWGKWRQLGIVRGLVLIWTAIIITSLIGLSNQLAGQDKFFLKPAGVPGGQFAEGVVGEVKIINPILPDNSASASAGRLIFSGLTRFNHKRELEPDLARSWDISSDGKVYTFHLRPDVRWHDGVPFTAQDVVFTLVAIQNPDSRSPLLNSWLGVKAEAKDDHTVVFTLPTPYTPFIYSTTLGILPRHRLETVEPSQLRVADFNQKPVGTGPFKLKEFLPKTGEVELEAYKNYHAGQPLLERFHLRWFKSPDELMAAYAKQQVDGIGQLTSAMLPVADKLSDLRLYDFNLPTQTNLFLRMSSAVFQDKRVREALQLGTDRQAILATLGNRAYERTAPILPGQPGHTPSLKPAGFDLQAATAKLDAAGWQPVAGGQRQKSGQALKLRMVTLKDSDYAKVAMVVQEQWQKLGIVTDLQLVDLQELQQSYIRPRNYDVLLFGINIGADPDVYPYWHSSQAKDPGLNLSQYSSGAADKALESARIVLDEATRAAKYKTFQDAWFADLPAIVLYTPYYNYAARNNVSGVVAKQLVDPSDRFYKVERWSVKNKLVPKLNPH